MKAKKRKKRTLGRLDRIEPGHPRWPRHLRNPSMITHMFTDWDVVVQVSNIETEHFGVVTHLWIRDKASSTHWPWYFLQEIKNRICGPERQAIEIFPKESELVDAANMRHLWVFPESYSVPFGIHRGVSA